MLTPRAYAYLAVIIATLIAGGVVLQKLRSGERAAIERETARDDATGRGLEVKGGDAIRAAQDKATADLQAQRKSADALDAEARQDPNAATPLPDSVRARIGAGDRELCKSGACR